MATPRPRSRPDTVQALIEAARELVATMPYEKIRTRDISERCGYNHGLITQYFGTKLGLFTEVLHVMGFEIRDSLNTGSTITQMIDSPLISTYWRLLASLLAAGMDPALAINEGSPVIAKILERSKNMTGKDFSDFRQVAAHAILLIGGYHVFGSALMHELSPDGTAKSATEGIQESLLLIMNTLSERP